MTCPLSKAPPLTSASMSLPSSWAIACSVASGSLTKALAKVYIFSADSMGCQISSHRPSACDFSPSQTPAANSATVPARLSSVVPDKRRHLKLLPVQCGHILSHTISIQIQGYLDLIEPGHLNLNNGPCFQQEFKLTTDRHLLSNLLTILWIRHDPLLKHKLAQGPCYMVTC